MAEQPLTGPEKLRQLVTTSALMTPRQRELVQDDIKVLERALRGEPMPYYGNDPIAQQYRPDGTPLQSPPLGHVLVHRDLPVPNRAELERNYAASQATLAKGGTPGLSGAAKNQIYEWYKAESEEYQRGMPSHEQLWKPTWHNLELYRRHKAVNRARAKFLQNAHYILDPQDDVFHLESLRPEKPTPYNGHAFRAGYEQLQWSTEQEMALQIAELDDETYYQFLQYKAQGITSEKLYIEKIGMTRQQYEACKARLAASAVGMAEAEAEQPAPPSNGNGHVPAPSKIPAPRGRPVTKPQRIPKPGNLSPTSQGHLDNYGDLMMVVADEGPITEESAMAVLKELDPDRFAEAKPLVIHNIAKSVLTSLVKLGHLVKDGTTYTRGPLAPEAVRE